MARTGGKAMNTTTLYCHTGRQRCPSPHKCGDGCNFDCATLESTKLNTAHSDSSNPGYPFELLDAPGNFWDRCNWWQKLSAVFAFMVIGGMVVSYLVGPK